MFDIGCAIGVIITTLLSGCSLYPEGKVEITGENVTAASSYITAPQGQKIKEKEHSFTDDDLHGVISNLQEKTILAGSEDVSLLCDVAYDPTIVSDIYCNADAVNFEKEGDYKAYAIVTASELNLDKYLYYRNAISEEELNAVIDPQYEVRITIPIDVKVVSLEDARKLADAGMPVYESEDYLVQKSDGTEVDTPDLALASTKYTFSSPYAPYGISVPHPVPVTSSSSSIQMPEEGEVEELG